MEPGQLSINWFLHFRTIHSLALLHDSLCVEVSGPFFFYLNSPTPAPMMITRWRVLFELSMQTTSTFLPFMLSWSFANLTLHFPIRLLCLLLTPSLVTQLFLVRCPASRLHPQNCTLAPLPPSPVAHPIVFYDESTFLFKDKHMSKPAIAGKDDPVLTWLLPRLIPPKVESHR